MTRITMGLTLRRTARKVSRLKGALTIIPPDYLPSLNRPPHRLAGPALKPVCHLSERRLKHIFIGRRSRPALPGAHILPAEERNGSLDDGGDRRPLANSGATSELTFVSPAAPSSAG
jgi:hypothetical protein